MTLEILFLVGLAALVLGPKRAAELGKDVAKWKTKLTTLSSEIKSTLDQELKEMGAKDLAAGTPHKEQSTEQL